MPCPQSKIENTREFESISDVDKPTTTTFQSIRRSFERFFSFIMSASLEATRPAGHSEKKFGKSTRHVPHHTEKAKKWYPAEDEVSNKKVG
jgi:hypothetical protein